MSDRLAIGKGVQQQCVLLRSTFNVYTCIDLVQTHTQIILRKILEVVEKWLLLVGKHRNADDVTLFGVSAQALLVLTASEEAMNVSTSKLVIVKRNTDSRHTGTDNVNTDNTLVVNVKAIEVVGPSSYLHDVVRCPKLCCSVIVDVVHY